MKRESPKLKQKAGEKMNGDVLLVSSVTYAMKGREVLLRRGLRAFVQRVPRTAETGCGYALYVPQYADVAEKILVENGVRVLGRIGDDSG